MNDIHKKILIDGEEFEHLRIFFINTFKEVANNYCPDEPVIQSTAYNFIGHVEENFPKSKTIQKSKSKPDLAWLVLENKFNTSKRFASRKLKPFISNDYKRRSILDDIGNAYALITFGFYKESVILSGGIIEEILRLYLNENGHINNSDTFNSYIKICEDRKLFRAGINSLSDSVRNFRNHVHLSKETDKNNRLNKANAQNALSAIFLIINEF